MWVFLAIKITVIHQVCIYCGLNLKINTCETAREDRGSMFDCVCFCVRSRHKSEYPNLSPMADNTNTQGGIGVLGSPFYICDLSRLTWLYKFMTYPRCCEFYSTYLQNKFSWRYSMWLPCIKIQNGSLALMLLRVTQKDCILYHEFFGHFPSPSIWDLNCISLLFSNYFCISNCIFN